MTLVAKIFVICVLMVPTWIYLILWLFGLGYLMRHVGQWWAEAPKEEP